MDLKASWQSSTKNQRQTSLLKLVTAGLSKEAGHYIDLVKADHRGVYASTGAHFANAIFGRDSIEVAEDLLQSHKQLVHDIILTLASLQGVKTDTKSEEEPGKIHHEYREQVFNGQPITEYSAAILHDLQKKWGGEDSGRIIYYGSYDATPLYIRLVARYMALYGQSILSETYTNRDGQARTMQDSLRVATMWLAGKIESSPWGLFEYKRLNPSGIGNQSWKDSATSYVHSDGSLANIDGGIASVELQGYAYDALLAADSLIAQGEARKSRWASLAQLVQKNTLQKLWMPERSFFAQGLDRDQNGETRQIDTLASNAGVLLESRLLADLPDEKAQPYVQGIVKIIAGPEFLTSVGIRSRALSHKALPGIVDYHGSYTVWPKETYDIAKGLRQFQFHHLTEQIENRILRGVVLAGGFYEFFYVESNGEVRYDRDEISRYYGQKSPGEALPVPEPGQAWTIAAVLGILQQRAKLQAEEPINQFESSVLANITNITPDTIGRELKASS